MKEFQELRLKGLRVTGYWFKIHAKQLAEELEPGTRFVVSEGWFSRFKARHSVSLRRPTNASQKPARDKEGSIQTFYRELRKLATPAEGESPKEVGRFGLHQIANMDQTPLPFCFTDGTTYDQTGAQTVWHGTSKPFPRLLWLVTSHVMFLPQPRKHQKMLAISRGT